MSKETPSKPNNQVDKDVVSTEIVQEKSQDKTKSHATEFEKNFSEIEHVTKKKKGERLAILSLLLTLSLGGAGFYFVQHHSQKTNVQINQLTSQLDQFSKAMQAQLPLSNYFEQLIAINKKLNEKVQTLQNNELKLESMLSTLNDEIVIKGQTIDALQMQMSQFAKMKENTPNEWKLAEANYLLINAQRKLQLTDDVYVAIVLLQNADQILSQLDIASVPRLREAINQDLQTLKAVKKVNTEQIILQLSNLSAHVDDLMPLTLRHKQVANEPSHSITDWQENAKKTMDTLMDKFIRVIPKTANSQGLLTPEQEIYLRENLRLRLQIATLAVIRHQEALYQQSLQLVADWVKRYFDKNDQTTTQFLEIVQKLQAEPITVELPLLSSVNLIN